MRNIPEGYAWFAILISINNDGYFDINKAIVGDVMMLEEDYSSSDGSAIKLPDSYDTTDLKGKWYDVANSTPDNPVFKEPPFWLTAKADTTEISVNKGNNSLQTELEAMYSDIAKKLGIDGGTVYGDLAVKANTGINISSWGQVSAGADGHILIGQNCYKNYQTGKYHFKNTHENMGAKGIIFMLGVEGAYLFDTGSRATTADEEFVPQMHRIMTEQGGDLHGRLHIKSNGGNGLALIGEDHVYVQMFKEGIEAGRSAYIGFGGAGEVGFAINNEMPGGNVNISAANGLSVNNHKVPTFFSSTGAPDPNAGVDGDIWLQYI